MRKAHLIRSGFTYLKVYTYNLQVDQMSFEKINPFLPKLIHIYIICTKEKRNPDFELLLLFKKNFPKET
jgi:hypothetical protein